MRTEACPAAITTTTTTTRNTDGEKTNGLASLPRRTRQDAWTLRRDANDKTRTACNPPWISSRHWSLYYYWARESRIFVAADDDDDDDVITRVLFCRSRRITISSLWLRCYSSSDKLITGTVARWRGALAYHPSSATVRSSPECVRARTSGTVAVVLSHTHTHTRTITYNTARIRCRVVCIQ